MLRKASQQKAFSSEVNALRYLSGCPGVPRLLQYGEGWLQLPAYALKWKEAAQGKCLKEILELVASAVMALGTIHKQGLVHRDIKPDNLMVTADGEVVIIDFGMTTWANESIKHWTGTRVYTAVAGHDAHASKKESLLSPHADLESLLYAAASLIRPLPWHDVKQHTPTRAAKVQFLAELPKNFPFFMGLATAAASSAPLRHDLLARELRSSEGRCCSV